MAGTAATVSVLGLIVFGTLASLLGKIGEQLFCRIRTTLYMLLIFWQTAMVGMLSLRCRCCSV